MRRTKPRTLMIVLTLGLVALAASRVRAQEPVAPTTDDDLRTLVERAGTSAANGNADRVVVFKRTEVEVEPSGLAHITERQLIKCLTDKGAAQLGRLRFDFDPTSNLIEIRKVRVLRKASGAGVETVGGDRVVELPQPQSAIYWGARMKLVPLPRLEVGDAVEVETYMKGFLIAYLDELSASGAEDEKYIPPMRGHFYDVVTFQDSVPVKLRYYQVTTPRDKPVQFETYGGEVESHVSFDAERLVYRFWKENLPAWEGEARAVSSADSQPKVVLATVPSWEDKSRWFAQVNESQFEATPAIRAKVAELTAGLKSDDEKIAAIVHWAADNIRYSGITMGKGEGYTLHPGSMIFEDRSGVCKDKAGMAITMLRAAGFNVYPAMTMAGARVERIPADQFNHCVTALRRSDGSFQLLDPTWVVLSPELWSSAEGEQDFLIGTPEGRRLERTPAFDPAANKVRIENQARLDADGNLSGTLVVTALGVAEQRLRREMAMANATRDRQSWFERLVGGIAPGAELEPVKTDTAALEDISKPVRFEVRYRIPRYALRGERTLAFAPPGARHPLRVASLAPYLDAVELDERKQALQLSAPRLMEFVERIRLPEGWRVGRLPAARAMDGKAAALAARAELGDGAIAYDYRLTVKRRIVPVEDYPNFRDVIREAKALADDLVILEREGK